MMRTHDGTEDLHRNRAAYRGFAALAAALLAGILLAFWGAVPAAHAGEAPRGCSVAMAAQEAPTVLANAPAADRVAVPLQTQSDYNISDFDVYLEGLDGSTGMLATVFKGKRYVVIIGQTTCGRTLAGVAAAEHLINDPLYNGIEFLVFDCDNVRSDFESAFSGRQSSRLHFYSPDPSSWTDYCNWMFGIRNTMFGYGTCISLPFAFAVDADGSMLNCEAGAGDIGAKVRDSFGIVDPSYEQIELSVLGERNQESARAILPLVNAARSAKGRPALAWDSDLEKTAIKRASELAVLYSHGRPDGTDCFTAWPDTSGAKGENIAMGYKTAEEVNEGWTNSPGHYANMISEDYTSMAAACFVSRDGTYNWVECFSSKPGSGMSGEAEAGYVTAQVSVLRKDVTLRIVNLMGWGTGEAVSVGDDLGLFAMVGDTAYLDDDTVVWASSNESVVALESDGSAVAKSLGDVTVTASLKGYPDISASADFRVLETGSPSWSEYIGIGDDDDSDNGNPSVGPDDPGSDEESQWYWGDEYENGYPRDIYNTWVTVSDVKYTGKARKPKPVVEDYDGYELVRGVDYELEYEDNVNVGLGIVRIIGIGDYTGETSAYFWISEAKQPMKVTVKTKSVKASQLKRAKKAVSGAIKVKDAAGEVTYAKLKGSSSKLTINKYTGKITVKKGTKRGTYSIKVKVRAAGDENHKAGSKTVTAKIKVK